ncbi:hypothetical protein AAES_136317 [Amazona aestiva]|uniref:Uncharacterized protein n=1 Tax=Amazona aestiva TaxID=12930 RepID=A0A0Q3M0V1_AMAAE|nr:hypothetical protein AAES_136317 [Amazona aestiva]
MLGDADPFCGVAAFRLQDPQVEQVRVSADLPLWPPLNLSESSEESSPESSLESSVHRSEETSEAPGNNAEEAPWKIPPDSSYRGFSAEPVVAAQGGSEALATAEPPGQPPNCFHAPPNLHSPTRTGGTAEAAQGGSDPLATAKSPDQSPVCLPAPSTLHSPTVQVALQRQPRVVLSPPQLPLGRVSCQGVPRLGEVGRKQAKCPVPASTPEE